VAPKKSQSARFAAQKVYTSTVWRYFAVAFLSCDYQSIEKHAENTGKVFLLHNWDLGSGGGISTLTVWVTDFEDFDYWKQ